MEQKFIITYKHMNGEREDTIKVNSCYELAGALSQFCKHLDKWEIVSVKEVK